jgi:hypothetical protein
LNFAENEEKMPKRLIHITGIIALLARGQTQLGELEKQTLQK